jgi:hypothetical protein
MIFVSDVIYVNNNVTYSFIHDTINTIKVDIDVLVTSSETEVDVWKGRWGHRREHFLNIAFISGCLSNLVGFKVINNRLDDLFRFHNRVYLGSSMTTVLLSKPTNTLSV